MTQKVTWRCPNHGFHRGDPDENPHTEIEATRSESDENSAAAKAFQHIDELA